MIDEYQLHECETSNNTGMNKNIGMFTKTGRKLFPKSVIMMIVKKMRMITVVVVAAVVIIPILQKFPGSCHKKNSKIAACDL
jgi:hypothetical protein